MWSSPGADIDKNSTSNNKVSRNSPSKSSSSTYSSPSPVCPSPTPNQSMTGASMEEVWNDINLASLHAHSNTNTGSNTNHHSFDGMIFQDFLARPSNKGTSTRVGSKKPSSGGGGGDNSLKNSLGPPSATIRSLNSVSDHFQYIEGSDTLPVRPNPQMNNHSNGGTISFDSSLDSPFDASGPSSLFLPICKKRPQENDDVSGGDLRHKRMIKNRESAARSRARKQAYTIELEREVAHLEKENAKLRRQQEGLLAAAPAQLPKKHTLYRTSTAPF